MELDDCIRGRRSIRRYHNRPVPQRIIQKLLDSAVMAPSGMNAQPWRFVVIQSKETIELISKRTKEVLLGQQWPEDIQRMLQSEEDSIFYGAPLLILMCVRRAEEWRSVNLLDCGLAAENMFLTAFQEGLGSCFIGFASFLNRDPAFLLTVGIPEDHELTAPMIFGYPAEVHKLVSRQPQVIRVIE